VVGTASHVGKSVLTMGLCRLLRRRGLSVAPFKGQNMALNSAVTPDGGEIGRAQASQAEAAGLAPERDMNPVLLKPNSDLGSQVVLNGSVLGNYRAIDYYRLKPRLQRHVFAALERLRERFDIVVMEGAGSCAEVNLRRHDLTNLSLGRRAGARALLVADIDAGGVFAQVLGTLSLLRRSERSLLAGVAVNKFRGDPALFHDGVEYIERRGRAPVLGVIPWLDARLPQEDGVSLERPAAEDGAGAGRADGLRVGVVKLARISNFTDIDALACEGASARWVTAPSGLAGLDLLILPGTKNTRGALRRLRETGLFDAIKSYHALGGRVLGLCGGYQILGRTVSDPDGVEGEPGSDEGLGLLPVATRMATAKLTRLTRACPRPGTPFAAAGEIAGYEIHMGVTERIAEPGTSGIRDPESGGPLFRLTARGGEAVDADEGWIDASGRAAGTYLHGLLDNDGVRAALWAWAGVRGKAPADYARFRDRQYDRLADHLERHLRVEPLLRPAD